MELESLWWHVIQSTRYSIRFAEIPYSSFTSPAKITFFSSTPIFSSSSAIKNYFVLFIHARRKKVFSCMFACTHNYYMFVTNALEKLLHSLSKIQTNLTFLFTILLFFAVGWLVCVRMSVCVDRNILLA